MRAAEKIRVLVENKGITYTYISKKTGIPVNSISRALMGKRRLPADEFIAICQVIGVSLGDLSEDLDRPGA